MIRLYGGSTPEKLYLRAAEMVQLTTHEIQPGNQPT